MLPSSHVQSETMQGNAESRQGQDRFHGFCAASSSLFPSCSNYCSSAQSNNGTSKPSEQMKSGLRANLSGALPLTLNGIGIQPCSLSLCFLFLPIHVLHMCSSLAAPLALFGMRHSQVQAPKVAAITFWHSSPSTPWLWLSAKSCSSHFMISFKR